MIIAWYLSTRLIYKSQKSITFLPNSSEHMEFEINNTVPFIVALSKWNT